MARLIFINGSMNSGKTTSSKLLAEALECEFIDFDDLREEYSELDLVDAFPKVFDEAAVNISAIKLVSSTETNLLQ